ncbi:hypothetical protein M2404_003861 [Rheinheimera pacifica]|uniref:DUF2840 domain-containing protein n=1 Tax=Rheinheimera pacifica TaxID=173990 RepID=UPI002168A140|nr:DUF2840 domain-containing protein [Rheinheimera pacifica]MCS4309489.1 hypothetical protein [Rheinheimera pacifica]
MVVVESLYIPDLLRYQLTNAVVVKSASQYLDGAERSFHKVKTDSLFVYERWTSNAFGTATWTLNICKATAGIGSVKIAGVYPGCQLLCRATGKRQVEKLKALMAEIGDDFYRVKPGYWERVQAALPTRKVIIFNGELNADKK